MPNIDDILEPILADLETCEDYARSSLTLPFPDGTSARVRDTHLAMARICASLRPVLDGCNEIGAELEVAQARIAELEAAVSRIPTGDDLAAVIAMAASGLSWAPQSQAELAKLAQAGIEKLLKVSR